MDTPVRRRDAARLDDDDRALHARLLRRDPTAPSDLAVGHLEPLAAWLRTAFPHVATDLLETAAIDLILSFNRAPEQYDPDRLSLSAYLRMAARADVRNALQRERRRAARQAPIEDVELAQRAGNTRVEGPPDPADLIARSAGVDPDTIAAIREHFDDVEWEVVQLMTEGERRTAIYAPILGLSERPDIDQAREVKRVKDRLWKRLQRLAPTVRRDD